MRLAIALALLLAAQAPVKVPIQSAPAGEDVTLTASNATPPLKWSIYQLVPVRSSASNGTLVFTRPAGMYLVQLSAANGTSTWQIQFTPGNLPNPGPNTPPTPQPIPAPPTPAPDPSNFIYPPDQTGFSAQISKALQSSRTCSAQDAASLSALYRSIAQQIEIDGTRNKPGLRTIADVDALKISAEEAVLKSMTGGKLKALKGAFPAVAKTAAEEYASRITGEDLTPKARSNYVDFLLALAAGIEQAKAQ